MKLPKYNYINTNVIKELCPSNHQVIIDVLECFVQEIDKDIEKIHNAVISSSQPSIKLTSHKVKISFKMLGENEASAYCLQLEHSEKMGHKEQLLLTQQIVNLNNTITAEVLLFIAELKESNDYVSSVSFNIVDNSIGIDRNTQQKLVMPIRQAERSTTRKYVGILIVEDNLANQKLIIKQINSLGYSCDHASDGEEGLKKWQENEYKLILTDCYMPKMDGYQMAQSIRQLEESSCRKVTAIIAVTGTELIGDDALCYQAFINSFLSKPVQLADLRKVLAKWYPHD